MTKITDLDENPLPGGMLSLQTVAMPKDTNASGDIFGGWLMAQMDTAGAICASKVAKGRVATVAVDEMSFLVPVYVGAIVSCYTEVVQTGRSSIEVLVEVWISSAEKQEPIKVTEGTFVFVAIDQNGRTRALASK